MSRYLLDTSALLIDYFREPGWQRVQDVLQKGEVLVAAPTLREFRFVAAAAGVPVERLEADLAVYLRVMPPPVAVGADVARRAWSLRVEAAARVPTVDCLIAACAATADATLVHRDPHFATIPEASLRQEQLPA